MLKYSSKNIIFACIPLNPVYSAYYMCKINQKRLFKKNVRISIAIF